MNDTTPNPTPDKPTPEVVKHYTNGEITVVWQPARCIHSTVCFKGLGQVFNPKKRPWVDMAAASTEQIASQVDKCPSKALTYVKNDAPEQPA